MAPFKWSILSTNNSCPNHSTVYDSGFLSVERKVVDEEFGGSQMSKIVFTNHQIEQLEANPNVVKVSNRSITYHPHFKLKAVKDYIEGKSPFRIFTEGGFDISVIDSDKPSQCMRRWRKVYEACGEDGLYVDYRGKKESTTSHHSTLQQELMRAEARIKALEMELLYLKKIARLHAVMQSKPPILYEYDRSFVPINLIYREV